MRVVMAALIASVAACYDPTVEMVEEDQAEEPPADLVAPDDLAAAPRYRIVATPRTWVEAEADCGTDGGYLVVIDDAAENDHVRGLGLPDESLWIGLWKTQGIWRWVSETPVAYLNWKADFAPDQEKDCAEMKAAGDWDDDVCDLDVKPYICERDGRIQE